MNNDFNSFGPNKMNEQQFGDQSKQFDAQPEQQPVQSQYGYEAQQLQPETQQQDTYSDAQPYIGSYNGFDQNTAPMQYNGQPQEQYNAQPQYGYDNQQYAQPQQGYNAQQYQYDYNQQYGYQQMPVQSNKKPRQGIAITSMILGIVSILLPTACCVFSFFSAGAGIVAGVVGLILSFMAMAGGNKGGFSITGLILSALGIIVSIGIFVLFLVAVSNAETILYSDFYSDLYDLYPNM